LISLVQIPVHSCYTGNNVRLEGYGYRSYWLTYIHCSHYKCIVTQNAQRRLVHAIKARQPRGGCEAVNGSCTTVTVITDTALPEVKLFTSRHLVFWCRRFWYFVSCL